MRRIRVIAKANSFVIQVALMVVGVLLSCYKSYKAESTLPVYGDRSKVEKVDTVLHQIPSFAFINQDSQRVTEKTFSQKIYVTDFFFTSCPTICPKMRTQMLRVYEKFKNNPQIMLLSHTLDPKHDSVAVLQEYAQNIGVSSSKWHFVTGALDSIYAIAPSYMVSASEKGGKERNPIHSGAFVLVDTNRHVRGVYDGTEPEQVDKLLADITTLLAKKDFK